MPDATTPDAPPDRPGPPPGTAPHPPPTPNPTPPTPRPTTVQLCRSIKTNRQPGAQGSLHLGTLGDQRIAKSARVGNHELA